MGGGGSKANQTKKEENNEEPDQGEIKLNMIEEEYQELLNGI